MVLSNSIPPINWFTVFIASVMAMNVGLLLGYLRLYFLFKRIWHTICQSNWFKPVMLLFFGAQSVSYVPLVIRNILVIVEGGHHLSHWEIILSYIAYFIQLMAITYLIRRLANPENSL